MQPVARQGDQPRPAWPHALAAREQQRGESVGDEDAARLEDRGDDQSGAQTAAPAPRRRPTRPRRRRSPSGHRPRVPTRRARSRAGARSEVLHPPAQSAVLEAVEDLAVTSGAAVDEAAQRQALGGPARRHGRRSPGQRATCASVIPVRMRVSVRGGKGPGTAGAISGVIASATSGRAGAGGVSSARVRAAHSAAAPPAMASAGPCPRRATGFRAARTGTRPRRRCRRAIAPPPPLPA